MFPCNICVIFAQHLSMWISTYPVILVLMTATAAALITPEISMTWYESFSPNETTHHLFILGVDLESNKYTIKIYFIETIISVDIMIETWKNFMSTGYDWLFDRTCSPSYTSIAAHPSKPLSNKTGLVILKWHGKWGLKSINAPFAWLLTLR